LCQGWEDTGYKYKTQWINLCCISKWRCHAQSSILISVKAMFPMSRSVISKGKGNKSRSYVENDHSSSNEN
jgi:hypothetical protein